MGKTTSATRVALAPAFVPCENNRNVTFWSERAWVRTPPESIPSLLLVLHRADELALDDRWHIVLIADGPSPASWLTFDSVRRIYVTPDVAHSFSPSLLYIILFTPKLFSYPIVRLI